MDKGLGKKCGQYFIFIVASVASSFFVLFHATLSLELLEQCCMPHARVRNFSVKKIFVACPLLWNF